MDLFCIPENSSHKVAKTPYLCDSDDRWDGGPFVTYPQRGGFLHMVPLSLRQYDLETPYTELIHPSELQFRQKIFIRWLFIGLVSEFLSSNEQEDPERPPDNPEAGELRASIYEHCVKTDGDGQTFLTGEIITNVIGAVVGLTNLSKDVQGRLNYLSQCLRVASGMLTSPAVQGIDRSLKFAIAGLGELMSNIIRNGVALKDFGEVSSLPQTGFDWKHDYLTHDDTIKERMKSAGWCPSDLGRSNALYQHLFTMHYLSLMDRHVPGRDHSGCTDMICSAAQIDNEKYQLSHDTERCDGTCDEFRVDIGKIKEILGGSETYPVLVFDPEDETALLVDPFVPGCEYIALSHVWADGLGNTKDNTLQKCQIARLRRLVSAVEDTVWAQDDSKPRPKYHIWVDTLCCPVAKLEPEYNKLSLLRMKTVYEQATHVLVLDLALSIHEAEGLRPATILLRIFGSSIWMRRLWTLQGSYPPFADTEKGLTTSTIEGVLANSMYFQFRDRPVHAQSLLPRLLDPSDFRYWIMWADINKELRRLTHLSHHPTALKPPSPEPHQLYRSIQDALDFRSVSYPSDEPICIATLLSLSLPSILSSSHPSDTPETTTEKRMCTLWRLLADADDGLPARLIFIVDTPLTTPGFGWAPNSMLGNGDNRGRQYHNLEYTTVKDGVSIPGRTPSGFITEFGLAVEFTGWLLHPKPMAPELPLNPWEGVLKEYREDLVFFRDGETGECYRMMDWHASHVAPPTAITRGLTEGEVDEKRVIGSAVDTGRMALIRGEDVDPHNTMLWLLVEILEVGAVPKERDGKPGYRVRWVRKVMVSKIAVEVAASEETREFVRVKGSFDSESKEFAEAKENVKQKLKDATAEAWKNAEGFATAVERTVSEGMEEYIWASIPMRFSHEVKGVVVPESQRWYVD
ncbi:hypothetical protein B0T14DRAFT_557920 [Immersiella caudata]|uniref:Heterokaryon incompatibility domain-containing protein n=1 Tax=Immersiella caudata TaxID=314043 RepID=A0AA39TS04_9PEZI|nr:hypothetical protein B0T14DRAFT_557920 [Immersiella caudata]